MKLVYTNENRLIVSNAKNILEGHGIETILTNEYAQSAVGEISAFDAWPELWVLDDTEYENACKVIENSLSKDSDPEWVCSTCGESNDASFGACWKCQSNIT